MSTSAEVKGFIDANLPTNYPNRMAAVRTELKRIVDHIDQEVAAGGGGGTSEAGIYNVETYGAIPLDPASPDSATAADAAITAAIAAAWADPTGVGVVYFPGTYRVNGDPSKIINGVQHYCMFYVPMTAYNSTTVPRKLVFRGRASGNADNSTLPGIKTISGSGLYCTRIETTQRNASVIGFEKSPYVGTFEEFNYSSLEVENFTITIKTNSGATDIVNYMSGLDANDLSTCIIQDIRVRTTSDYASTVKGGVGSFGVRMPKANNHVLVYNGVIYTTGFDRGTILGEHSTTDYIVSCLCRVGITARATYPNFIGQACLEGNEINFEGENNSQTEIGVFQTENYPTGKYPSVYDIYSAGTPSLMHLTIGQQVTHAYGGASVLPILSSIDLDVEIRKAESGLSHVSANLWTTSSRPATMLRYGAWGINTDDNSIEWYSSTGWQVIGGTVTPPTYILLDDFNRSNSTSSLGNLVTPNSAWSVGSGTWGIISNKGYCVSEIGTGGTVVQTAFKDAGVADYTYSIDLVHGLNGDGGIAFRYVDNLNYYLAEVTVTAVNLYKVVAGAFTMIGSFSIANPNNVVLNLKVVCAGSSITIYKDNVSIIAITDTTYTTQTKVGMAVISGTGFGGGVQFDNLKLY